MFTLKGKPEMKHYNLLLIIILLVSCSSVKEVIEEETIKYKVPGEIIRDEFIIDDVNVPSVKKATVSNESSNSNELIIDGKSGFVANGEKNNLLYRIRFIPAETYKPGKLDVDVESKPKEVDATKTKSSKTKEKESASNWFDGLLNKFFIGILILVIVGMLIKKFIPGVF